MIEGQYLALRRAVEGCDRLLQRLKLLTGVIKKQFLRAQRYRFLTNRTPMKRKYPIFHSILGLLANDDSRFVHKDYVHIDNMTI